MEETPLNPEFIDKLKSLEADTFPAKQLDALKELQSGLAELTTVLTNGQDDDKTTDTESLDLLQGIHTSLEAISSKEDAEIPDFAKPITEALDKLQTSVIKAIAANKPPDIPAPVVNVPAPKVQVDAPKIDLSGVQDILRTDIPAAFDKAISNIPEASPTDMSPLLDAFAAIQKTLDEVNVGVRLKPQSPSTMKVTNPDGTVIGSSGSSGTQYTDGASAVTHPVGTQPVFTNGSGKVTAVSTTNPLPTTAVFSGSIGSVTNDGTFAKETGGNLDAIKTDVDKIPSQGQALAAGSMPVVLTAAQITTLTPPAAITNYANETGGNLAAVKADLDEIALDTDNLALIKAKTDNLDVALSTRLKPADTLTKVTTVDTITNPVAVTGTFFQATQPISGTVTSNIGTTNGLALDATLTSGNQQVQGNVAAGATDSGSPVKTGGVFNTTNPTLTTGQRGDSQLDLRGNTKVTAYAPATNLPAKFLADNTDGVAVSTNADKQVVMSRGNVFNGTTWDRAPGDATNGAFVNLKSTITVPVSNANLDVALSTRLKPADTLTKVATVDTITNPVAVTGTFWQTTQPVSVATVPQATLPATEVNGQTTGTTAGTAVQLASNALTVGVIVQALSTNATSIYVGTSSVTSSNGFELQPGQATSVGVNNTSAVWIVSTTNGDKVCWIGS